MFRLARQWLCASAALLCLSALALSAQTVREKHLPVDGWIAEDGRSVALSWRDTSQAHRGPVEISRRALGAVGGATWEPIEISRTGAMRVLDESTAPGQAYEYRVLRRDTRGVVDAGFWIAGRDLPEIDKRGTVHLVVDQSVFEPISLYLARFRRDLVGDGWAVRSYGAPRHNSKDAKANIEAIFTIKQALKTAFEADPFGKHVVILVGRVPVARSGNGNPDGHGAAPLATDLIYGDVDGRWRITSEAQLLDTRLPSDAIEMQVGRIDFSPVNGDDPDLEIRLLRSYFDKNHHWRHGRLGDLREAYGGKALGLIGEINGLRNIVGAAQITKGGHHDVGEDRPWLWGVDFGHHAGKKYAADFANKAVFAINFGSHKQKIDRAFNPMTALLAQPWYTLAVGWGARPSWWLHHMALGGTIGDVHMRTVNNGVAEEPFLQSMDYFPTGQYLWRNPIWVNLLGDPTLRAFPLSPPRLVQAVVLEEGEGGVRIFWEASEDADTLGYRVYRQQAGTFDFILVSGETPLTALEFTDHDGAGADVLYMVRAAGRKEVPAGSFNTLSQGVFVQPGRAPLQVRESAELPVPAGAPFVLPENFGAPQQGLISSFVWGPLRGELRFEGGRWQYTPPEGFTGTVPLRYVVSDALTSVAGVLALKIGP